MQMVQRGTKKVKARMVMMLGQRIKMRQLPRNLRRPMRRGRRGRPKSRRSRMTRPSRTLRMHLPLTLVKTSPMRTWLLSNLVKRQRTWMQISKTRSLRG